MIELDNLPQSEVLNWSATPKKKVKKKSKLQKRIDDPYSRLWRNKADKLWKEMAFREGKGVCAICGSNRYIQVHHLVPRNILLYRHDIRNAITLCPSHHKYSFLLSAHKNPVRFILWIMENQPEKWEWLSSTFSPKNGIELGDGHPEVNYKEVVEKLLGKSNIE